MTLAIIYSAAVTALLAFVFYGYVADYLHEIRGDEPRLAVPRTRRVAHLRRIL